MRKLLNKYGRIVAGVIILIAGVFVVRSFFAGSPPSSQVSTLAFYVDEETGDESVQSATEIPPLMGKNGKPTVVRAIKYSCDGGKSVSVLMYVKYADDVKAKLEVLPRNDKAADLQRVELQLRGLWYRAPAAGSPWISSLTPEAERLAAIPNGSDGTPGVEVFPQR